MIQLNEESKQGMPNIYGKRQVHEFFDFNVTELTAEEVKAMEFNSLDDAQSFYLSYAHIIGFCVSLGGTKTNPKTWDVIAKYLYRNKEGEWSDNHNNNNKRIREPKNITRTGCEAKMRVVFKKFKSKWVVTSSVKKHNHEFREVPLGAKVEALAMRRATIQPS
ncbi:protein FAR1-RELATED SEQUENCE 5-like [Gossypium arboreum]|nr:protein FAR1-RELATED SEQUENCE 5-like [Gossypium arboreum]